MRGALIVAGKEFRTYFRTPIAYVFLFVFLSIMGWLFFWVGRAPFFKRGIVEMRGFFEVLPIVFLFFVPAMSMRMWAEEKKQGTLEILLTMPLREQAVVAGKFLAGLGLLLTALVLTFPIPCILVVIGDPDVGPILCGYAGAFFLGAAYLSIGLFASSLTENQIVAFIVAVIISFVLYFMGFFSMQGLLPAGLERAVTYLSLDSHFKSMQRGVLDSRDILYYVTAIVFFLWLNARVLRGRG